MAYNQYLFITNLSITIGFSKVSRFDSSKFQYMKNHIYGFKHTRSSEFIRLRLTFPYSGININCMTITRRTLTEKEFIALKDSEPFATMRQNGKTINFSLVFGASYMRLSETFLEIKWSQERIDNFIEEKDLYDDLAVMTERWKDRGIDPKLYGYYTVASYIRTKFFETFPGLMTRMKRNEAFAIEHGWIRSYHGGVRRVPLMSLAYGEDGKSRKHENKKELANWKNITANSTIQTDESVHMHSRIASLNNPKIIRYGFVHDSLDSYVEREGSEELLNLMVEHFNWVDKLWQHDMKFPSDISVVDMTKEGQYYKHGIKLSKFLKESKK